MAEEINRDETTLGAVHRVLLEVEDTKEQLRNFRQQLKDTVEQNQDYQELQDEVKELTIKRQVAKKLLEADKDYQLANSEVEELKFKLKDLGEILSHHLVTYYNETNETVITDTDGEKRQVILTAKIGKSE